MPEPDVSVVEQVRAKHKIPLSAALSAWLAGDVSSLELQAWVRVNAMRLSDMRAWALWEMARSCEVGRYDQDRFEEETLKLVMSG